MKTERRLSVCALLSVLALVTWLVFCKPVDPATCIEQSFIPEESEWQIFQVVSVLLWCFTYFLVLMCCAVHARIHTIHQRRLDTFSTATTVFAGLLLFWGLAQGIILFHAYPCVSSLFS